jgi:phage gp16-like protein|nr:MAG TPA: Protein of unknown function (DUF1018) [Caudoviricetes sp.]
MPADKRPLIAKIHIAKTQLGLDEEQYRDVLRRVTKKDSAAKCTYGQLNDVLKEFKGLGFKTKRAAPSAKAFVRKIYAQWAELGRLGVLEKPDTEGLRRFIKNHVGVDKPEWLTYAKAAPVINALKAWIASAKKKESNNG